MLGIFIENLRKTKPLIHNITNYVTVNDVANIILASGASPIMSDEPKDVKDITSICGGLNINIGTLNKHSIKAMFVAGNTANKLGKIVLLDPVGSGASKLRTSTALKLIKKIKFDVIRGNISEIKSLISKSGTTKGVDADTADTVTENNLEEMIKFAKNCASHFNCIIAITGAIDLVANEHQCFVIRNGKPQMSQITGTGCMLSGLTTAFLVANKTNKLQAVAAAVCTMGIAGEIGLLNTKESEGNSTYRNKIIDAVYNMTPQMLEEKANYEIR